MKDKRNTEVPHKHTKMAQEDLTSTAAHRVLYTPELLEMILLGVFGTDLRQRETVKSVATILRTQRVDRFFRQLIQNSVQLRRAVNQLALCGLDEDEPWIQDAIVMNPRADSALRKRIPFAGIHHRVSAPSSLYGHEVGTSLIRDDLAFLANDKGSWRNLQVLVRTTTEMKGDTVCYVKYICWKCTATAIKCDVSVHVPREACAGELADTLVKKLKEEHGARLADL